MHIFTHLKPESEGKTGLGIVADGMTEHDNHIGMLLNKLDELKNHPEHHRHLDHRQRRRGDELAGRRLDAVPGEKNTNWEGGYRVPLAVRWPGVIKPGTVINDIVSHEDWLPTLLAAAGQPNVKEALLKGGTTVAGSTFKVHLDGYNLLPLFQRRDQGMASQRVHLLDRRRRSSLLAIRPMEDGVPGAARGRFGGGRDRWSCCASPSSSTCAL